MIQHNYDIIIIGAGIVGISLACLLENNKLNIAIIEHTPPPEHSQTTGLRQRAINRASQHIFEQIGIWDKMHASPYTEMRVWENHSDDLLHFKSKEIREPDLGHIVSEEEMHFYLYQKARALSHITFYHETVPEKIFQLGNKTTLFLKDGRSFSTSLLIGADGRNSWLREAAHINSPEKLYFQKALVANIETECSHQKTAWQRFLPEGPLAFLPLNDPHQSSIVWTNSSKTTDELLALDEQLFKEKLAKAFEHRLGRIKHISTRLSFTLSTQHAEYYVKPGIALLGDAAHRVHPLAGLGLNLGLADAAALAHTLQAAKSHHCFIGDLGILRKYERKCRAENTKVLLFVDQLKKLFMKNQAIYLYIREYGIPLFNDCSAIKNYVLKEALKITPT
jgi:2-octaprenylphenol hydroxylase